MASLHRSAKVNKVALSIYLTVLYQWVDGILYGIVMNEMNNQ